MDVKAGLTLNSMFLSLYVLPFHCIFFLFPLSFFFLQSYFSKCLCAISWTDSIYLAGGRFAFSKFMCLLSTRGSFNVSCLSALPFDGSHNSHFPTSSEESMDEIRVWGDS